MSATVEENNKPDSEDVGAAIANLDPDDEEANRRRRRLLLRRFWRNRILARERRPFVLGAIGRGAVHHRLKSGDRLRDECLESRDFRLARAARCKPSPISVDNLFSAAYGERDLGHGPGLRANDNSAALAGLVD